jgi:hypothetical protein
MGMDYNPNRFQERSQASLVSAFWLGVGVFCALFLYSLKADRLLPQLFGFALGLVALAPSYVWCRRSSDVIPIYPLYSLTYLWSFSLPVVHQGISFDAYTDETQVLGCIYVILHLVVGLGVYMWWTARPRPLPRMILGLQPTADGFYLGLMGLCIIMQLVAREHLLRNLLLTKLVYTIQSNLFIFALGILAYRLGKKELRDDHRFWFFSIAALYFLIDASSLLLFSALRSILFGTFMYVLAARRISLVWLGTILLVAAILHQGKGPLRVQYWTSVFGVPLTSIPMLYVEWVTNGVTELVTLFERDDTGGRTLAERTSLMNAFLSMISQSPDPVPYCEGKTYWMVFEALLPRLLFPDKGSVQESMDYLAISYGFKSADAFDTTIGVGLLCESFANFGIMGVIGSAVVISFICSWLMNYSTGAPVTSFRTLLGLTFISQIILLEHTASMVASATVQGVLILCTVAIGLMQPIPSQSPVVTPPRRGHDPRRVS